MCPSMFTWVSAYTAYVVATLLSDRQFLEKTYFPTLRRRIQVRRDQVAHSLCEMGIPFVQANGGMFYFIDLSQWLQFAGEKHLELELLHELMKGGVFLEPGSVRLPQLC